MRSRFYSTGPSMLVLSGLSAILAGCSSGTSQNSLTTASLAPRPQTGMVREEPRRYPDGSTSGGTYSTTGSGYGNGAYGRPYAEGPRTYVDPGRPTPREYAAYDSGHDYAAPRNIQTASVGAPARSYDPNARWQQPSHLTTGSTGSAGSTGFTGAGPHVYEVREGDTLYSLSRRYDVPVGDLAAANRLHSERIAIGQRLVIPTRYR